MAGFAGPESWYDGGAPLSGGAGCSCSSGGVHWETPVLRLTKNLFKLAYQYIL